ncbi:hypothetical protein GJR96_09735 [Haloferax sp. MBLA0076]|uniref:Uncharacterized protein n=1 Tax=Haloferax litoreum TaxID=2666140 RepID=A0A6A8GGD6_9EURY|nr:MULTISPECIES: hypothetical protein [Haloferax]KAB1193703.1 hypothetical protein Hfx1148_09715 [Haloferax sp. CBA1148]MRX22233.1 hypothetical protein [Haloferax litoreum]
MSFRSSVNSSAESSASLAVEAGFVVAALLGVALWQFFVDTTASGVAQPLLRRGGILVGSLVTGGILLAGLTVYASVYTSVRDIDVPSTGPSASDAGVIALTVLGPAVLVGATKLVGSVTGVTYGSLTKTGYGADATLAAVFPLTGLELVVGVPVLVLVSHVFVQSSFRRVATDRVAIAATTVTTVFVLVNVNRGLVFVPNVGRLAAAAVFLLLLGVALTVSVRTTRDWTRVLCYVPALGFVVVVIGSELVTIGSVAVALFVLSHALVLGIAAYAHERTRSLFVPALAYISLIVSTDAVVFFFEAGL